MTTVAASKEKVKTRRKAYSRMFRESYLSTHILLNLLNKLGEKRLIARLVRHLIFFATSLMN